MSIVLTDFARSRLFREHRRNTIQDCTPEQFERHLDEVAPLQVLDGYAPFCKLHVHRNWTSTRCLAVPITDGNRTFAEWTAEFDCAEARERELAQTIGQGVFQGGFDALKSQFGAR